MITCGSYFRLGSKEGSIMHTELRDISQIKPYENNPRIVASAR